MHNPTIVPITATLALTCMLLSACNNTATPNNPQPTNASSQLNDHTQNTLPNFTADTGNGKATARSLTVREAKNNTPLTLSAPHLSTAALDGLETILRTGAAVGTPLHISTDSTYKNPLTLIRTYSNQTPATAEAFYLKYNTEFSYWEPHNSSRTTNRKKLTATNATPGTWTDVIYAPTTELDYLRPDGGAQESDTNVHELFTAPWKRAATRANTETPDALHWYHADTSTSTKPNHPSCTTALPSWVKNLTPGEKHSNSNGPIHWCLAAVDEDDKLIAVHLTIVGTTPLTITTAGEPHEATLTPGNLALTKQLHATTPATTPHQDQAPTANTKLVLTPGQTLTLHYHRDKLPTNWTQKQNLITQKLATPADYMASQIMDALQGRGPQADAATAVGISHFIAACGKHVSKVDDGSVSFRKLKTCLENNAPTIYQHLTKLTQTDSATAGSDVSPHWITSSIMTTIGVLTFAKKAPTYARTAKNPAKPTTIGFTTK